MLQRQTTQQVYRHNFQHKLQLTEQQISSDFYQLTQLKEEIKKNRISQPQCSKILQQMIQKMSHPIIGIQLLKDKFDEIHLFNNTGFKPFETIQLKAQAIYVQMIMGDLNRMLTEQFVDSFSRETVKNIVDQINWKIDIEKSIHDSRVDQVGEHVDLMKFFEGVRNYQNWNENVKKETIEKLKSKAQTIKINLTLKKGFILSKIQKIASSYQKFYERLFIQKCKNQSKLHNISNFTKAIQNSNKKISFDKIYQKSMQLKDSQKICVLFDNYYSKKLIPNIQREILKFLKISYRNKLFVNKLEKVFRGKQRVVYSKFLEKINFTRKIKARNILAGLQKISLLGEKKAKAQGLKLFKVPQMHFLKVLNKTVTYMLKEGFKAIKGESQSNIVRRPTLSLKLKGKILDSLPTPESRPVDIRSAFLNWYTKGNELKFSKQIYNIWLTGTTSKFTFFMRLKNLINQNRNYKIKYELKLFLMIFNEKMNRYYNHVQKSTLQKWITNTRRINKIQKTFQMLSRLQEKNNQMMKKTAWQSVFRLYRESMIKQKFCFKYSTNYLYNIKNALNSWKILPDVKRSKGQILIRKLLSNVLQQIFQTQHLSFSRFKQHKLNGRNKKIKILQKAFNLDYIYLQKYYQMWRMKKNALIKYENDFELNKKKKILLMQKYYHLQYKKNIKDIIIKFYVRKNQQKNRDIKMKKVFVNILKKNSNQNMINVMSLFKTYLNEGINKKNNLVKWLVESSKKKQTLTLHFIKNKAYEMHNLEKIRRTEQLFTVAEDTLKQTITIFDKSQFVFGYLRKVLANRARNFHLSFKSIQALPNRINWQKRNNGIKFYQTIQYFYKRNKGLTFGKMKQSLLTGRFKLTKSMDIMASKYFDVTRKYFNNYRKIVNRIKMDQLNKNIGASFEHMNEAFISNLKTLFINEAVWKKKADQINKLNQRVKIRMGQAFKLWRQTSKAMIYFQKLLDQKKSRYIQVLTKALGRSELSAAKRAIISFKKNVKVTEIQQNFLKKLCDGQAGKVVKAIMIWKNLPEPKNKQKIAKATKFQSMMSKISMRNFKKSFTFFKDDYYLGCQKKKHCVRQLVAKSCSGIKSYFEKWKQNNKLSILFGQCEAVNHLIHISNNLAEVNFRILFEGNEASNKRQKLHQLDTILCQQKKELLSLWRQKAIALRRFDKKKASSLVKLAQIQQSTQNKNLRDYAIKKYVQLRLMVIREKEKRKESKLLQIIDNSNKKRKQNISESFEGFKFNLYKGNFKKKKAFQNWLRDKIAYIHGIYAGWDSLAKQAVLADKRKFISQNFQQMDNIVRANIQHLISNRKQMQIKKKTLVKLFNTQQLKLKGSIRLWQERSKEIKMLSQMDKQTKTSILERINKIVSIGSQQNVKAAIQKFHQSMKVEFIQKKFINQLLKTKSGLVLEAVNKWKTIPAINLGERYKKGQKFFNKLESFQRSRIAFVYQFYKKNYDDANMFKKQAILQLFDVTSTGIRKFYRRWQKLTKEKHTLTSVNHLMKSLDIMNEVLSNQYMIIFQDQRAYTVKVNAINKLIIASQGTVSNYFGLWRNNIRQLKFEQSMGNEKKTLALSIFTKALQGSQKNMLIDTVRKFRQNAIVTDISKKFFNRLLQTKSGKVVVFFEKLKSIPDAKVAAKKKKAIKFQSSLNKFAMKIMRTAFNPFKSCNFIAIDRKKYCINKLIRKSMGQQFRSFTRWRNVTQESKVLMHSQFSQKCFENMQAVISNTIKSIFFDSKEQVQKKRNLCRKLVMNSQFVQHHAFMRWKQAHREDDFKIFKRESKVRDVLKNLLNVFSEHQKKKAISGFAPFRNFLVLDRIEKFSNFQKKVHTKAYSFYDVIEKLKNNRISAVLKAYKNSAIQMNFATKISALEMMFKNSTQVYGENMMLLMRSEKQSIIIQKALNRIFANFKVGTERAFSIWRENTKVIKLEQRMGNEKKKNILQIMNKFLQNGQMMNLKKTIESFNKNFRQTKIQKDILMKIISCKSGAVPILFMKWKALPSQTGKKYKLKAIKFQIALFRAWNVRMKTAYQSFKNQNYAATVKKQFAIRKLISVTQSDTNRVFNKWRKVNNESVITEKMINMDKVFSFTQGIFFKSLEIFNQFKEENNKKVNALNKIFFVQSVHLKDSLRQWIDANRSYKIEKITLGLGKYTEEQFRKRFTKEAFEQIKQRFEIQTMKGYINSLWKWKMSNTENQYYQKFIKVFSQSEELLNLSKLLNKKQSDTLHLAFTQIKISAKQRFDKKVCLVEKYLLKKAKAYFQKYRANSYREEVSTWKNKYGQVVKTQKFTYIMAKITRKQQNEALTLLKKNQVYLEKVEKMMLKLQNYNSKNLKQGLKNIYRYGFYKLLKLSFDTRNRIKEQTYADSFKNIAQMAKLRQFNKKIHNVSKSAMIRRSFQLLRKNADRLVRKKLSLLLLANQINNKRHQNKVKAIQAFQKRRIKYMSLNKVCEILLGKVQALEKMFFQIDKNDLKILQLLQLFKKGTTIKNIIQKQDKKLLKGYFDRLKKKENKWISEAIRKFATRSSLRSSVAVSLWRLKSYAEH